MSTRGLSILVLAYNEAENLTGAISEIRDAAMATLDDYEIIVVNDGSTDRTGAIADQIALTWGDVRTLHHDVNRGLRAGYETGLAAATLPFVGWLPADREITPASIAAIFRAVGTADIVAIYHGNPSAREWVRRALTCVSTWEMNLLFGHDRQYFQGANIYPTDIARRLPRTEPGFFVMAEMYLAALDHGLSVVEVPIVHQERTHGVSKAVGWGRLRHAQMAVLKFWWRMRVTAAAQALGFALVTR